MRGVATVLSSAKRSEFSSDALSIGPSTQLVLRSPPRAPRYACTVHDISPVGYRGICAAPSGNTRPHCRGPGSAIRGPRGSGCPSHALPRNMLSIWGHVFSARRSQRCLEIPFLPATYLDVGSATVASAGSIADGVPSRRSALDRVGRAWKTGRDRPASTTETQRFNRFSSPQLHALAPPCARQPSPASGT